MALSVYFHIPYCLQRCRYCDFTTFEWSEILPPEKYTTQVLQEIRERHHLWADRQISTVYFGGGTPSLLAPELIVSMRKALANVGFEFLNNCETTLEINPATLTEANLDHYLANGFNRFSVGAQSFNDSLLKMCGRKHTSQDTRRTIQLLKSRGVNFSFDLLFALPGQTLEDLETDLQEVCSIEPPHLSAYCLTVPEGHPMSKGRPPENDQIVMFQRIEDTLKKVGLLKYEISNFAKPGFESQHNLVYWQDRSFWGLGLSAHSYQANFGSFGMRFWNPKSLEIYGQQVGFQGRAFDSLLPASQFEKLEAHESLTDFCHMSLRTMQGLSEVAVRNKFAKSNDALSGLWPRLEGLKSRGLLRQQGSFWQLTEEGCLLSNLVYEKLTFFPQELSRPSLTCSH